MFGGLIGSTNRPGVDFGEQMLNAVASQSIRHLFTQSESVEVEIRCHPSSKLLQGIVDSFKMNGRALVIRREFEAEEMSFETDTVSIDPASLLRGQLRLRQPTQAVAQVVLTEDAINRAFKAQLVQKRLQNVDLEVLTNLSGGEPISFREVQLQLLPDNGVRIKAFTDLPNRADVPISLEATIAVEKRRRLAFKDPQFISNGIPDDLQGLSKILTDAFAQILNDMIDLDRFDLDGVKLRLNRLETHGEKLVFSGYAEIQRIPGSG
jgi:hypothetical protein